LRPWRQTVTSARQSSRPERPSPMTRETETIIVRYAQEVATKSNQTRKRFDKILKRNIDDAMASVGAEYSLKLVMGRIMLETAQAAKAMEVLPRVFGISSVSLVRGYAKADLEKIIETGKKLFADTVRDRTFVVRAKRTGKHPFKSPDIERRLGGALVEHGGGKVKLRDPEVTVRVEVMDTQAFLYTDRVPGAGGLPLGTQGRVVTLMSGGFDSPVAAWRVMRRGAPMDFVFCNLGGVAYERSVLMVTKALVDNWSYGYSPRFHVVEFNDVIDHMRDKVYQPYWQVVLKRLMYRAANKVAFQTYSDAILTGEAIGQVSSQTLSNLASIESISEKPVLRPAIGFDKDEIIREAFHIGTGPISENIKEFCNLTERKPVTSSSIHEIDREEGKMDLSVLAKALEERKVLEVKQVTPRDLSAPYLFKTDFPDGATVIDCRHKGEFEDWHVKGAEHHNPFKLLENYRMLDKDTTYIVYCSFGTQSPYVAETLQRQGYDVYAFEGDIAAVRKYAEENGLSEFDEF